MNVAHWRFTFTLGPSSNTKNWFIGADHSAKPPGQYSDPVKSSNNSAAAREYVLCPLTYPRRAASRNWDVGTATIGRPESTPPASSMSGTSM